MKPVCALCDHQMKILQIGVLVGVLVKGQIYQVWSGDHWICDICAASIVVNYGKNPIWTWADIEPAPTCFVQVT